jgi:hypothetical protein
MMSMVVVMGQSASDQTSPFYAGSDFGLWEANMHVGHNMHGGF